MKESRAKLFTTNILVYGFGGVVSKMVPLIMVPIVTRLIPDAYTFGLSDLTTVVVSLFSSLAIMGMYDAMFRMFFEKDDETFKKTICSSAFFFSLISSLVVCLLMVIFQRPISSFFFSSPNNAYLVSICAINVFSSSTNAIISAPTRMQNKKGLFLIGNCLTPVISYGVAIPLLLNGLYLLALPLSFLISSIFIEVWFFILNKKWFSFRNINWNYIRQMLVIALPLLPNFIIYWIFNSSDRVMISNLIGTDASGIYAVSSKIGHISQLIYTAFAGGWQFFSFSIMKDKDSTVVNSRVLELLTVLSLTTTAIGSVVCKIGVELLFDSRYWSCYVCVPYLYLAPLLLMLYQVGANQFTVIKKTWPNMIILSLGAIVNVALNFVLIPKIGIEGASIATFIGYFISISVEILVLTKLQLIRVSSRFFAMIISFIVCFGIMRFNNLSNYCVNIVCSIFFVFFVCFLYRSDLLSIWKRFEKALKGLFKNGLYNKNN